MSAPVPGSRPIRALIDRAAMRANLARARAAAPSSRVWAVVKANAYGHGLQLAREAFADADGLALVEFEGAAALREAGWRKPVLMVEGAFALEDVALAARLDLSLVVHAPYQLDMLRQAPAGAPVEVFLKFNTGMNRLGFAPAQAADAAAVLRACASVRSVSLMTHFADADGPWGVDEQLAAFGAARAVAGAVLGATPPTSTANSAAVLRYPQSHGDWVRPGIMLYGCSPFPEQDAASLGLLPAMTLQSEVIAVQSLCAGDAVGYGRTFVAPRDMRVGVVACGYADGYPRHAPGGNLDGDARITPVLVAGKRTRTIGRVAMDMLYVDLTGIEAGVGAPVTLWGRGLSADEVATAAGTVSYELLCALAPRVPVLVE